MIRTSYSAPDTAERADQWRQDAACARPEYADQRDIWFAPTTRQSDIVLAKSICKTLCPVREECLAAAVREEGGRTTESRYGIRGGLQGAGRRRMYDRERARRRAAEQASEAGPGKPKPKRMPAQCGTRSGYQKHVREKTKICDPCRQANTDADNRLRRTGTTKVSA